MFIIIKSNVIHVLQYTGQFLPAIWNAPKKARTDTRIILAIMVYDIQHKPYSSVCNM
jgi:hypothetical protein